MFTEDTSFFLANKGFALTVVRIVNIRNDAMKNALEAMIPLLKMDILNESMRETIERTNEEKKKNDRTEVG